MGSRIAGHLANAGIPVVLLDMRTDLAQRAVELLKTAKPPALFDSDVADLILTGNFTDDLSQIASCDWVIEAVTEDLSIKQTLLKKAAAFGNANSIFTTNTSGLPVTQIAAGMPADFRRRWFGVHFFNPPRVMRLVEFIPTADSDSATLAQLREFVVERLGKTVVTAKDTPNFIANRIGIFALLNNVRLLQQLDLSIEEIDTLTGSAIGWPATATFRLMDLIGIDVVARTYANFSARLTDERSDVIPPPFMAAMVERGWLGDKSGQGFYRKGSEPAVLDWKTFEYRRPETPRFAFLADASKIRSLSDRLQFLLNVTDPKAEFYRHMLPELWAYAHLRVPEISDNAADIDTAMKAGFNWELGPFEMQHGPAVQHPPAPIAGNASVSLRDLGDGIACIEFHTKMNAIDDAILCFVEETLSAARHTAYVIGGSTAANFSAGANLASILDLIERKAWQALERFISAFQRMTQSVKFCSRPVVAAPFGMCLGGGAEVVLHATARQVHAELSMGLVEISVGLIPGGGGCKEMALRAIDGEATWPEAFYALASAQRSGSARQAKRMRLLKNSDGITMNRDLLLRNATSVARDLANGSFTQKTLRDRLRGADPAALNAEIESHRANGTFTEHDAHIGTKITGILCAGVSEQHLLDLEREAFVSLCGEQKTAERIAYTLKAGKPLRN
jgi:3-hydroxyacyl-CoA dehydrogenase